MQDEGPLGFDSCTVLYFFILYIGLREHVASSISRIRRDISEVHIVLMYESRAGMRKIKLDGDGETAGS